jgi:hypothetical protein
MLTVPLTVVSIMYPPIVYVNRTIPDGKTLMGAVNINYWWIPYV